MVLAHAIRQRFPFRDLAKTDETADFAGVGHARSPELALRVVPAAGLVFAADVAGDVESPSSLVGVE
jgi:hypothetical protein